MEFKYELFEELMGKINKENKLFYLIGDFNIDMLKINSNTYSQNMINRVICSSFYPQITKPTRITHKSATLIDNIMTNRLNSNDLKGILFTDISDHLPIFTIERDIIINKNTNKSEFRQITPEKINILTEELSKENWIDVNQAKDANEAYNLFQRKLSDLYNKAFPMKTVTNKERKRQNKPWLTKGIIKSLKTKNNLYKRSLKNPTAESKFKYKQYRNKLHHLLRIVKRIHHKNKFEQTKNNIRQTWIVINEIINKRKTNRTLPETFICDDEEITDPTKVANKFNEYFVNVGPKLASKIPLTSTSYKSFLRWNIQCESLFIDPLTEEEIEKELLKLNPKKSVGYDNFSPNVIRDIAPLIKQPLTTIFNKSFSTGIIPEKLKISLVTPIYKN